MGHTSASINVFISFVEQSLKLNENGSFFDYVSGLLLKMGSNKYFECHKTHEHTINNYYRMSMI